MSVFDIIEKISNDENLSERFCDLENLEDIKKFIKKFDSSVSDEEIEKFVDDTVYKFSELASNDLQDVPGGAFDKKLLSFPLALLSTVSVVGSNSNCMAASTIAPSTSYAVVKQEEATHSALGERVLEKFKSNVEVEKSVDRYKLDGFLSEPTETNLPNNMQSRQKVFFDTLNYCAENKDNFGIAFDEEDSTSEGSSAINYDHEKFMDETKNDRVSSEKAAKIWLTNGRSLQSLNAVNARLGIDPKNTKNVALLNFANYFVPGGGVTQGCRAQEESLCRVSTLYGKLATKEMKKEFYEKHIERGTNPKNIDEWKELGIFNECIYTMGVKQIKEDYAIGRVGEYVDGVTFNVITAAAPDFRGQGLKSYEIEKYKECIRDSWRMIFATAYMHGDTTLVLGALGCGAFRNDPELVAEAFYDVLTEQGPGEKRWMYCFENIILPIYTLNKSDQNNYDKFKKAYEKVYYSLSGQQQIEIKLPSIL